MEVLANVNYSKSVDLAIDEILGWIPALIGAVAIVLVGWVIAMIAKRTIKVILQKLRFDRSITLSPAGNYITRIVEHPSTFIGKVVYWVIYLSFLLVAISNLGVTVLTNVVNGIYSYIPNVIAAIIIFLIASAATAAAEAFVVRVLSPGALAKLLGAIIPAIIMPIAIFMILNQLHIAKDIVNITYVALVGSVSLGLALAFGLGGREVAAQILNQAYEKAQENSDQIKSEMTEARRKTRSAAQRSKRNLESQA